VHKPCLQALRRADLREAAKGNVTRNWYAPIIVADAEAGFGDPLNAYKMMRVRLHLMLCAPAGVPALLCTGTASSCM
jgi:isocitrate lyase